MKKVMKIFGRATLYKNISGMELWLKDIIVVSGIIMIL